MARRRAKRRKASAPRMSVTVSPSPEVLTDAFEIMLKGLTDYRPALRRLPPILARGLQENINSQGRSAGEVWPELSESRRMRKIKEGLSPSTMIASERLLEAVGDTSNVQRLSRRSMSFGITLEYPPSLNWGFAGNNTPRRAFMVMSNTMNTQSTRIVDQHLRDVVALTAAEMNKKP